MTTFFQISRKKWRLNYFLDFNILLAVLAVSFIISNLISPLHIAGDQTHYEKAYELIRDKDLLNALGLYRTIIFTDEIGHFLIIWIAANLGIAKLTLMSFLNSGLACLNYYWLRRKGFSRTFSLVLTISNYYLYAMFFTLERLKVAAIFLLLFLTIANRSRFRILLLFASAVSHIQTAIITGIVFVSQLMSGRIRLFSAGVLILFICLGVFWITQPFQFFYDKLTFYTKTHYLSQSTNQILAQTALLPFFVFCSKNRKETITFLVLLIFLISILGGDRLNMFFYFGFIYFSREKSIITKFLLLLTAFYFTLKITSYLVMVSETGG